MDGRRCLARLPAALLALGTVGRGPAVLLLWACSGVGCTRPGCWIARSTREFGPPCWPCTAPDAPRACSSRWHAWQPGAARTRHDSSRARARTCSSCRWPSARRLHARLLGPATKLVFLKLIPVPFGGGVALAAQEGLRRGEGRSAFVPASCPAPPSHCCTRTTACRPGCPWPCQAQAGGREAQQRAHEPAGCPRRAGPPPPPPSGWGHVVCAKVAKGAHPGQLWGPALAPRGHGGSRRPRTRPVPSPQNPPSRAALATCAASGREGGAQLQQLQLAAPQPLHLGSPRLWRWVQPAAGQHGGARDGQGGCCLCAEARSGARVRTRAHGRWRALHHPAVRTACSPARPPCCVPGASLPATLCPCSATPCTPTTSTQPRRWQRGACCPKAQVQERAGGTHGGVRGTRMRMPWQPACTRARAAARTRMHERAHMHTALCVLQRA